jgi:hypothetical protein
LRRFRGRVLPQVRLSGLTPTHSVRPESLTDESGALPGQPLRFGHCRPGAGVVGFVRAATASRPATATARPAALGSFRRAAESADPAALGSFRRLRGRHRRALGSSAPRRCHAPRRPLSSPDDSARPASPHHRSHAENRGFVPAPLGAADGNVGFVRAGRAAPDPAATARLAVLDSFRRIAESIRPAELASFDRFPLAGPSWAGRSDGDGAPDHHGGPDRGDEDHSEGRPFPVRSSGPGVTIGRIVKECRSENSPG